MDDRISNEILELINTLGEPLETKEIGEKSKEVALALLKEILK